MAEMYSGSEIVELGIQIEINGRDFYNTLVKRSKNEKAKKIFKYLAGEEGKHIVLFRKILDSVYKYEPSASFPLEYFEYLNALASSHVFTQKDKGEEVAKKIKSDKEVVELGIGFEKDSIIFYEGMKKVVLKKEQKVVDELIQQEQNHLMQLTCLKEAL